MPRNSRRVLIIWRRANSSRRWHSVIQHEWKKSRWRWAAILFCCAPAGVAQVDPQRAAVYFKEAAALCEQEHGKLWGVSLCGPMVIADEATHTIATSQPAP